MVSSSEALRPCPQCGSACSTEHSYCPACGFPVGTVGKAGEDRLIGRSLPGGYHVIDLISVGGMGRVYRAEQSVLGRTVAVKVIHPHLLADENSAVRFMTEARAASQLNHPNSVAVFDFGRTDDGQPYLVMEFLRGKDLARVAWEEGPLPFARVVDVLRQVLAALGEAHDLGIVHRDLKPENVILEPLRRGGDFVKVVDFGLAKLKAGDDLATNVTSPGIVCGTPDYMAPEQGRGDAIDGRSDLYAVGVILFQLLTGRLPFEADSPTQVVMMHLSIPVPDPRQVAPERDIPDPLVDVCLKALRKDARERYQDAHEFADALKQALALAESGAPAPTSLPPTSLVAGATTSCPSCSQVVPLARFCCECGARLPARSTSPELAVFPLAFVGRDDDVEWLEDRRVQAEGQVVGARLVGEPGSGKTRLLDEFLDRARSDGDTVVLTGPDPFWAEVACSSVRAAILALAKLDEQVSINDLKGLTPEARRGLEEVLGRTNGRDERAPAERRFAVAEALRWALSTASQREGGRRVVLAVDELHRIDPPSRFAFADALAEAPPMALLLVCSHIPGFESGWGASHGARLLAGLPPPALSRLLRRVPGSPTLSDDDNRGILPMYVEQLARFVADGGQDPPTRLGDLVALRIDTLEPEPRRTLQALAVLGDRVMATNIAQLLSAGANIDEALSHLEKAGMISRTNGRVSTSHPLLREIVLAGLPAAVRKELHSKALRNADERGAPLEAKANHAFECGDSFQALLLLEQVADRASARGDAATEVEALRRGLEVARREIARGELDDPMRAVLIFARKLGTALTRTGNFADAEGVLREALDFAGPSGTDRARVLSGLAHVAHGRRRSDEAIGFINQAIETAKESGAFDLVDKLNDTRRAWAS
ncbi:MAG: protein kinase [Polyangiaceae bacterium]